MLLISTPNLITVLIYHLFEYLAYKVDHFLAGSVKK